VSAFKQSSILRAMNITPSHEIWRSSANEQFVASFVRSVDAEHSALFAQSASTMSRHCSLGGKADSSNELPHATSIRANHVASTVARRARRLVVISYMPRRLLMRVGPRT
jgi:hypothetical protein